MKTRLSVTFLSGLAAMAVALVALIAFLPVPLPDTATSTGADSSVQVNDWVSTGHTFRVSQEGLYRIDVPLSTLSATDQFDLEF